jgi:molecular chaperone DnaK
MITSRTSPILVALLLLQLLRVVRDLVFNCTDWSTVHAFPVPKVIGRHTAATSRCCFTLPVLDSTISADVGSQHIQTDCNEPTVINHVSVGIDLGTTYSLVAVVEDGVPIIVPIEGRPIMPSIVAYCEDGSSLVGEAARQQEVRNPRNTFSSVKRIIGKSSREAKSGRDRCFSSKILPDAITSRACRLACPALNSSVTPEEVSSLILQKLIVEASRYMNQRTRQLNSTNIVSRAVITVPAYFSRSQREATEQAGRLAGLQKVRLLREPEAAALAYGLDLSEQQLVLVFDLGGGTLDVSVLDVGNGFVEVIATNGDPHLGGDDFDYVIVDWLVDQFELVSKEGARHVRNDVLALARLRDIALQAKKQLSVAADCTIEIPSLYNGVGLPATKLTRGKFESLSRHLLARILKPLREVAIMAQINLPGESGQLGTLLQEDSIDDSVVQGAELSVSELRKLQLSGRREAKDRKKTRGATGKELRRLQRESGDPSLSMFPGGQQLDEVLLVGGATRIPSIRRLVRTITGVEPLRSMNPDEAVCLGAGTLAGVLDGTIPDMQVVSSWQAAILRTIKEEKVRGNDLLAHLSTASNTTLITAPHMEIAVESRKKKPMSIFKSLRK